MKDMNWLKHEATFLNQEYLAQVWLNQNIFQTLLREGIRGAVISLLGLFFAIMAQPSMCVLELHKKHVYLEIFRKLFKRNKETCTFLCKESVLIIQCYILNPFDCEAHTVRVEAWFKRNLKCWQASVLGGLCRSYPSSLPVFTQSPM